MTHADNNETILRNARIILADEIIEGSLCMRGEQIHAIDSGSSNVGDDMEGDFLIPGLVELHTDHLENHYRPRPGVDWQPLAAVQAHDAQIVSSGITTVLDALRVGSDGDKPGLGGEMQKLAGALDDARQHNRLRADHLIHLRCEVSAPDVVPEAELFLQRDDLKLISLMDHTPGQRQFVSLEKFYEYYQGKNGMSDAEMEKFIAERRDAQKAHADPNRRALAARCREFSIPMASHDDATPEHVREAVEDGVVIAEFPTTVEAAEHSQDAGLAVLMGAPNLVRGRSHSGNVSAKELADLGRLDILSSDYVPFSLLHATMHLPDVSERFDLPSAVALVTRNPANAIGLNDRGEIANGKRADILRVAYEHGVPHIKTVWRQGRRVA